MVDKSADKLQNTKELALRNELLRLVLRETLKRTGVPPQWIGGEVTPFTDLQGQMTLEVRLVLECDEPRFLHYLSKFQSEFESRLLAVEPRAWDWVSRISWSLGSQRDENPEFSLPPPEYWELVVMDRELTARKQGRMEWDSDSLARHFENTLPGMTDFENTVPPERGVENISVKRA